MAGRSHAAARRSKAKRKPDLLLWGLAIAGLAIIIAGVVLYAVGSRGPEGAQGTIKVERAKVDMGNVPYEGGLAKAIYNITAEGGPVTVKTVTTT